MKTIIEVPVICDDKSRLTKFEKYLNKSDFDFTKKKKPKHAT